MFDDRPTLDFPRTGTTRVGFAFEPELIRCIAAGPGGHPLHVLIDTGTDPSAIDLRLAQRLIVPQGGSGLGRAAATDALPFTEATLPWLRIGELTIRNLFAPIVDLGVLPFPVDVVLGYNVLQQVSLQIDYRHHHLTFAHPDLCLPHAVNGTVLPLDFFEHFPALRDLEVDGCRIPLATIDTGSNGGLTVGPDLAVALELPLQQGASTTQGFGFGAGSAGWRSRYREVCVGPFQLADVDLDTLQVEAGDLGRPGRANIGNRLMARFARLTLDYERRMAVLEPDHETA